MINHNKISFHIEGNWCILMALLLLLLPLKWVMAMMAAMLIHELGHALAILFFGGNIYAIHFGANGIQMEAEPLPSAQELIAALAGPVASAALVMLSGFCPRLAVCGAVHCIYNLLPLFPLDGGRVLMNLMAVCLPNGNYQRLFRRTQNILRVALAILCGFAAIRFGILPAMIAAFALLRQKNQKSCKIMPPCVAIYLTMC